MMDFLPFRLWEKVVLLTEAPGGLCAGRHQGVLAGLTLPSRPGAPQVASLRGRGPSHPPPPFSVCSASQQGCPCLLPSSLPVPTPTKPSRHGTGAQCLCPGRSGRQSGPVLGSSPTVPEAERVSGMQAAVDAFEQTHLMMPQHTLERPRLG